MLFLVTQNHAVRLSCKEWSRAHLTPYVQTTTQSLETEPIETGNLRSSSTLEQHRLRCAAFVARSGLSPGPLSSHRKAAAAQVVGPVVASVRSTNSSVVSSYRARRTDRRLEASCRQRFRSKERALGAETRRTSNEARRVREPDSPFHCGQVSPASDVARLLLSPEGRSGHLTT